MLMEIEYALIEKCMKDNREAQEKLYYILYAPLIRVGMRYYVNENDSIAAMHNAYLKILDKLHLFRYNKSFMNWAKRIMINTILDEFRKKKLSNGYQKELTLNTYPAEDAELMNDVEKTIEKQHVMELLSILPEATRVVFNLYVFEGYTHKDIGKSLKISENTSKWHLSNGRIKLKAFLEANNYFDQSLLKIKIS
ncbi:MAG TPA: hypothetical protein DCX54_00945 [Flavobacteriales bacterium]|nr:hypothetical protein [Flavobacteriales bacterium]